MNDYVKLLCDNATRVINNLYRTMYKSMKAKVHAYYQKEEFKK